MIRSGIIKLYEVTARYEVPPCFSFFFFFFSPFTFETLRPSGIVTNPYPGGACAPYHCTLNPQRGLHRFWRPVYPDFPLFVRRSCYLHSPPFLLFILFYPPFDSIFLHSFFSIHAADQRTHWCFTVGQIGEHLNNQNWQIIYSWKSEISLSFIDQFDRFRCRCCWIWKKENKCVSSF